MVALLILLALFSSCLVVGESRGENARAVLYQEVDHRQVVARGGTVQRGPDSTGGGVRRAGVSGGAEFLSVMVLVCPWSEKWGATPV